MPILVHRVAGDRYFHRGVCFDVCKVKCSLNRVAYVFIRAVCNPAADVVFLIDQSSSIRPSSWSTDMQFIANVINQLNVGPNAFRVAAVKYSTSASLVFNLNQYSTSSQAANAVLNIVEEGGPTNLAAGFQLAFSDVFQQNQRIGSSQVGRVVTCESIVVLFISHSSTKRFTVCNVLSSLLVKPRPHCDLS